MSDFRLIDFLDYPVLNALRFQMGARLASDFVGNRRIRLMDEDAIRRLGKEGIDLEDLDEIHIEADKTLSYRGKRVVIYIRDVKEYKSDQKLPKFHFSFCNALQQMQRINRWHKYVVANNDEGKFLVNFTGGNGGSVQPRILELAVCQFCLGEVGWEGFRYTLPGSQRAKIVNSFSLAQFFQRYPKDLLSVIPTYDADTAPLNDYVEDWGLISEALKNRVGFVCSGCGLKLTGVNRQYLHTHHKNGAKNDNSPNNLEVLCLECHAEQPMHSHLKGLSSYKEFMVLKGEGKI